jgi:hypothetical protein
LRFLVLVIPVVLITAAALRALRPSVAGRAWFRPLELGAAIGTLGLGATVLAVSVLEGPSLGALLAELVEAPTIIVVLVSGPTLGLLALSLLSLPRRAPAHLRVVRGLLAVVALCAVGALAMIWIDELRDPPEPLRLWGH